MKSKNLTDNVEDLPKWAQGEVRILQMRLREAKEELLRIHENQKSNTVIGNTYMLLGEPIKYLRDNERITFILEKGEIQARIEGDTLEIHAMGEGDLFIRPRVSNAILLHLK